MSAPTAVAVSRFDFREPGPHHFTSDSYDPGYRPCCRICGKESARHPYFRHDPKNPTPRWTHD
jgi:hypothetical protein